MSETLSIRQHKLQQPALIDLYTIDSTMLGGPILRLTPNSETNLTEVVYGGNTYKAFPVKMSGVSVKAGDSAPPRPTLRVANDKARLIQSAIITYGDMLGALVTRRKVYSDNLDSGSSPDGAIYLAEDNYTINQKKVQDDQLIMFELVSMLDLSSKRIPARQILKDQFPGVTSARVSS